MIFPRFQFELPERGCQLVQNGQRNAFLYVINSPQTILWWGNLLADLLSTKIALHGSFNNSVLTRKFKYYSRISKSSMGSALLIRKYNDNPRIEKLIDSSLERDAQ